MTSPDIIPSSTVTLDDSPDGSEFADVPQPSTLENPNPNDGTNPPSKEQVPDADALVLELSKRGRELSAKQKEVAEVRRQLDAQIQRHKQFDEVLGLAKTDPLTFITRMAEAAGVDELAAVEAFIARKNGNAPRQLTAEERMERFEAERKAEREANDRKAAEDKESREKAEGEAALAGHLNSIKSLATASKDNFPLFNDDEDFETNAVAAFDLMVMAHSAGKPVSHAAAVQMIEKQLRTDAERKVGKLGYSKNQTTTIATPTVTQTPRSIPSNASAAPIASTNLIRSDDEIAADWGNY